MMRFTIASWRSGKKLQLKYPNANEYCLQKEEHHTDIGGYFQILIGALMTASFVTIVLILLNIYYGKDEKEAEE